MAEIKWIKITTNIFDDEKIKIIDTYPARDEIIVIWFKLLALAGKVNQNGMLFMNNRIAYTPEMLSAIFNRELNSIKLAISTFEQFGMIEVEDNELISIANWDKHQNIDGMDKIREQNRIRQQEHRQKKKQLQLSHDSNVTVTLSNAIEEDKEEETEENIIKEKPLTQKQVFSNMITEYTNDLKLIESIENFIEMRKSIKAKLTTNALKLMLNKLSKLATTDSHKIEILDQSTMNSWKSIFAIKDRVVTNTPNYVRAPKGWLNNMQGNKSHNFSDRGNTYNNDELEKKLGIKK